MTIQISPEQWNDYILFQFNGLIKTLEASHHEELSRVILYIAQEFQTIDNKVLSADKIVENPENK